MLSKTIPGSSCPDRVILFLKRSKSNRQGQKSPSGLPLEMWELEVGRGRTLAGRGPAASSQALRSEPGSWSQSMATSGALNFMVWELLGTHVLSQDKLPELLKSRQAHSMRFRNRNVKRTTAVLLNWPRVPHYGETSADTRVFN